MREYMDYLEELFLSYVGWNVNDSYANITMASESVLDFNVPEAASLKFSSQSTPNTFTTYSLKDIGSLKGTIAYLYSSCPEVTESSSKIPLRTLVQCYRKYPLRETQRNSGSFLFGRMYLPGQQLEAMCIQTLGLRNQLVTKCVIDPASPVSPGIFTMALQSISSSWTREYIYSSHENLFGFRCLSNLCTWTEPEGTSQLVAGSEVFFAAKKKSPGMSLGLKYSSRSLYSAVPLTLSVVLNPLMGNVSTAYTVKPTKLSAFSTRFDFNLFSYMSDLTVGCELWRNTPISLNSVSTESAGLFRSSESTEREGPMSVFKASTSLASQTAQILWEGSFREFLVSTGLKVCYGDRAKPVVAGLELTYAS